MGNAKSIGAGLIRGLFVKREDNGELKISKFNQLTKGDQTAVVIDTACLLVGAWVIGSKIGDGLVKAIKDRA